MPEHVAESPHHVAPTILAALRVYLGVVLLVAVWPKVFGDPSFAAQLPVILERLGEGAYPVYRTFLHAVVVPHSELFAALVTSAELFAGVTLAAGAATRLGAAVAAVLFLNYMALKGVAPWAPSSNDAAFLAIAIAVFIGAAGRRYGVDRLLVSRWSRVPLW